MMADDPTWEFPLASEKRSNLHILPTAAARPPETLPYFTFEETEANLDCADFVEGVLTDGAMSVIYGESNTGKTFWITDLGFHVAAGKAWCGREVEQGAVLYFALEGSHGIRNRIAALKAHHGMEDARIPLAVVAVSLNLLDPNADADSVIQTVRAVSERFEMPIRLIVVDTLARAMAGGNENSPEDMGALVTTGDKLRGETGAHVAYVHHSGKDTAKGARGHSSLRAATDTEIEITADGPVRTAAVKKQRDLQGGDQWQFKLEPVVLGQNRRGKDVTSCVVVSVSEQVAGATSAFRKPTGDQAKRALELLVDLIAESGQSGHEGCPGHCLSVPDKWWRQRFYDRSMPADTQEARQKAFKRASTGLLNAHFVGFNKGRVWLVNYTNENRTSNPDNPAI